MHQPIIRDSSSSTAAPMETEATQLPTSGSSAATAYPRWVLLEHSCMEKFVGLLLRRRCPHLHRPTHRRLPPPGGAPGGVVRMRPLPPRRHQQTSGSKNKDSNTDGRLLRVQRGRRRRRRTLATAAVAVAAPTELSHRAG